MAVANAKICGVSTPEAVSAALNGGAGWLGFNFFSASPRYVTPELAARLAEPARGRAKIVAVTVDPDDALVERLATVLAPDLIQFHGRETPPRVREAAERAGSGAIKVLSISEARDLDAASAYQSVVDHLMFDAKTPRDAILPGGLGVRFDWTILEGRRYERPHFLAGGLDPWNVAEAIKVSGAPLVDVSSGVERGPGLKDPALITAFLDAVRRV
jgi:phosphoribosylanthranilate isomerase